MVYIGLQSLYSESYWAINWKPYTFIKPLHSTLNMHLPRNKTPKCRYSGINGERLDWVKSLSGTKCTSLSSVARLEKSYKGRRSFLKTCSHNSGWSEIVPLRAHVFVKASLFYQVTRRTRRTGRDKARFHVHWSGATRLPIWILSGVAVARRKLISR